MRKMFPASPTRLFLSIAILCASAGAAHAQTTTALLRTGDVLLPGRTASAFSNVYANHVYGFAARVNSTDGVTTQQHFWGNATGGPGALFLTMAATDPYTFSGVEGFFGYSDAGDVAISPTVSAGAPVSSADSVFINLSTPIAIAGVPCPTIPNTFWSLGSRPTMTGTGEVWFSGGVRLTVNGSTSTYGLFRNNGATAVLLSGGPVGGTSDLLRQSSTLGFTYRVSRLGTHYIVPVTFAPLQDIGIVVDGSLFLAGGSPVREGTVVPVSIGGNGSETYSSFTDLGVRESGGTLISASSNAPAATNSFLMVNGVIVLREGDLLSGLPITGAVDAADLNEQGDWAVNWAVNSGGTREAIIVNGNIVIKETDPIDFTGDGVPDDGVTLADITGLDCIAISDRRPNGTVDVYFTGEVSSPEDAEGLFRITVNVGGTPLCTADFNGTGGVTADDIFAFLDAWFVQNGTCTSPCSADFNGAGGVTADDIFAFLDAWFAQNGTCGL